MGVAARGAKLEPSRALPARRLERLAILALGVVGRAAGAMHFGLQPRVLGVVGVLAGGIGDARRLVERGLGAVEIAGAQLRAGEQHQIVRPKERGSRRRVRREAFLEDAQPALQIAELDERAADERRGPVQLLRDPVRVTDDGELLVRRAETSRGVRRARCTNISKSSAKASGCG